MNRRDLQKKLGYNLRRQIEVVGQENKSLVCLRIPIADTSDQVRVISGWISRDKPDALIALDALTFVHLAGIQSAVAKILLCPCDEKCSGLLQPI